MHVQNGTPGIFQNVNQGIFPTGRQAEGLKATRQWATVWQVLTMGMAKAAPDALPNSWVIGGTELAGQHEDGNSTGAVLSLPAGNWRLRAEHYANVCGLLSELAGEGGEKAMSDPRGFWQPAWTETMKQLATLVRVYVERETAKVLPAAQAATVPAAVAATPVVKPAKPSGRLKKEESEAMVTAMLAMLRQHPGMKDDPKTLAGLVGVSETTIRRWLDIEEKRYRDSRAANPEPAEE